MLYRQIEECGGKMGSPAQVYIGNILPQIPQIVADFNRTEIIMNYPEI